MAADPVVAPPRPRVPQRARLRPAPPPRRVSGPARTATRPRPVAPPRARRVAAGTVALPAPQLPLPLHRLLDALRALPDARWLDRLLRGQGWIVLIGLALMGIVAMQVSLLKMNAGIGQRIERAAVLERQNADLRTEVSQLSSEERIAAVALENGLVMPDAGEVRYVSVRGEMDARKAASVMRAPDPVDGTLVPAATATSTTTPTATTTAPTTPETTAPATSTPTATATPPAEATAPTPTEPVTPAPATETGTTAGATEAQVGATAAPGQ